MDRILGLGAERVDVGQSGDVTRVVLAESRRGERALRAGAVAPRPRLTPMSYDAVLLDLYDTLVWSDWYGWQDRLADRLGVTTDEMSAAFSRTRPARSTGAHPDIRGDLTRSSRPAASSPTPELVDEIVELEAEMAASVRLYGDSLAVVRGLRERGVPTALVSNCSHNTRPIVERLGLEREFDAVILSFEGGR